MDYHQVINDIYAQVVSLKRQRLKPTAIIVGDKTFMDFLHSSQGYYPLLDTTSKPQKASLMGIDIHRTIEDQPFMVLTDGRRDQ